MTLTEDDRRQAARGRLAKGSKTGLGGTFPTIPAANIGQRHMDYGLTPREHALAKQARKELAPTKGVRTN